MSNRIVIVCSDPSYGGGLGVGLATAGEFDLVALIDDPSKSIPECDGLVLTTDVAKWSSILDEFGVPVLIVDERADPQHMVEAVESGALGYITADSSFKEIAEALESVLSGLPTIPTEMLGSLLRRVVERRRAQRQERTRLEDLTGRELEIFELMAQGFDKDQIAELLFISPGTVRTHKQRMFRKLALHSEAEVVAMAARCGLELGAGGSEG